MSDPTNPVPPVEPSNPPPKVEPPPPPPPPAPSFSPDEFMNTLDTKMTAWSEKVVTGIKEAFPTPVVEQPKNDPPPPKDDPPPPPKADPPTPGKKTLYEWWFGGSNAR